MMRNSLRPERGPYACEVVFRPAVEPLEAAMIPAKEHWRFGVLAMVPRAYDAQQRKENQRAKIWVR